MFVFAVPFHNMLVTENTPLKAQR